MKLRNKLLTLLAPTATLVAVMPAALTSCNNDSQTKTYIKYNGDKTHESTGTWQITFTLVNALEDNQSLKVSFSKMYGGVELMSEDPVVMGTQVTIYVENFSEVGATSTFDLCFKCFTEPSTVVTAWEQTITGFSLTKK